jgi:RHS repeat-associated protein
MKAIIRLLLALAMLVPAAAFAQTSPWSSGTYLYDGAGNVKRIGADYYVYDMAGRLIQGSADKERSGVDSYQTYTYDMYGNRTTAPTFGTPCIGGCGAFLDINEFNHIRTTSHGASYDGGGNLKQFDNYQYTYDAEQMMTRIKLPNTTLDNQYIYTADDERLATFIAPGQWRFTVRDLDEKAVREVTASEGPPTLWSWDRDHVFRDGLLLATVLSSNLTQHYHLDHLGTPKLVTNNNGAKVGVHAYYPFGEELNLGLGEGVTERLQFTGQERDMNGPYANALDYMHARYYAPANGRFLSPDRVMGSPARPQSWNRYTYARNQPIRLIDPTGLSDVTAASNCGDTSGGRPCVTPVEELAEKDQTNMPDLFGVHPFPEFQEGDVIGYTIEENARKTEAAFTLTVGGMLDFMEAVDPFAFTTLFRAVFKEPTRDQGVMLLAFRIGLARLTGGVPPGVQQAHHIFPRKFSADFERLGIDWNNPEYGAWWRAGEHQGRALEYNRAWEQFLRRNPTREEVLAFGKELAERYGLRILFKLK